MLRMVDILLLQTVSIAIASAGVFLAAIYYILQIRHQTKMRQADLIVKLYSQFSSLEFTKVVGEVLKREAKDYDDYRNKYGMAEVAAVGNFFEGIGILLKRKLIDIELVDDMFTSPIKWTWEKTRDLTMEMRMEYALNQVLVLVFTATFLGGISAMTFSLGVFYMTIMISVGLLWIAYEIFRARWVFTKRPPPPDTRHYQLIEEQKGAI